MTRSLTHASMPMLVFALLGCEADDPQLGPNGQTLEFENIAAMRCQRLGECLPFDTFDSRTCVRSFVAATSCGRGLAQTSQVELTRCLEALRDLDCDLIGKTWWPPACNSVLNDLGTGAPWGLGEGELCGGGGTCAQGLLCEGLQKDCAGRCVPLRAEGESCLGLLECDETLICSGARVCEPRKPAGVFCRGQSDCVDDCVDSLCASAESLSFTACSDSTDCGTALRCRGGTCSPLARLDERCSEAGDCFPGSSCIDGRCVLASACGAGRKGDACMANGQCSSGLVCDEGARRCVSAPQLGDACSLEVSCAKGLSCVDITLDQDGVCQRSRKLLPNGAECEAFWDCDSLFCAEGACARPVACPSD
jgi:hypothetical protein